MAIEVSSHALELHRADAIHFAASIFTNLTQDHLDFHPSMERYFAAKRRLFELDPGIPVVNVDDAHGRRLAAELADPVSFGIDREADYAAHDVSFTLTGARFVLRCAEGSSSSTRRCRAASMSRTCSGRSPPPTGSASPSRRSPRPCPTSSRSRAGSSRSTKDSEFAVLVDYAHTPDSLANVLATARALTAGRLICVFGCGGDRDRGKRPLMGEIAARLSDIA